MIMYTCKGGDGCACVLVSLNRGGATRTAAWHSLQTAQIHGRRRNFTAPTMATLGVGVTGEGIKRWGIEGIRIGNFDRFGRAEANY